MTRCDGKTNFCPRCTCMSASLQSVPILSCVHQARSHDADLAAFLPLHHILFGPHAPHYSKCRRKRAHHVGLPITSGSFLIRAAISPSEPRQLGSRRPSHSMLRAGIVPLQNYERGVSFFPEGSENRARRPLTSVPSFNQLLMQRIGYVRNRANSPLWVRTKFVVRS